MELEVVQGEARNRRIATELASALRQVGVDGTLYLGYPVLASSEERVQIDALLVSRSHGLVAFQLSDVTPTSEPAWQLVSADQDRLYGALESNLGRHDSLRRGRRLAVPIETVTVFPTQVTPPASASGDNHFCGLDEVGSLVRQFGPLDGDLHRALQAALQRIVTIKPAKKRAGVQRPQSRGWVLKQIEREIANLDRWQKRAAIETPDGPQRVRGLAGSGKTIVLALKAAYLHAQHPDWLIGVTFQSRALYQQLEDLIVRFSFEHSNDKPDFERLRLMHAWGGADRDGVYTTLARAAGQPVRDFLYARASYGSDGAFQGVCRELLNAVSQKPPMPIFDAILIDEAQDLPPEFFRLAYSFTKAPKRIVWAYDELQKLSEAAMPSTRELFGVDDSGKDLIDLRHTEGEPRRDVILPVCYRNPPWSLATAHALGFGIYNKDGIVQHFDDPSLWREIGYQVIRGELAPGKQVVLERDRASSPEYFKQLLTPEDALTFHPFADREAQDSWVAEQIKKNLEVDELEHDDILIVLPNVYTAKTRSRGIAQALARHGLSAHSVGITTSRDEVFRKDSVAIAHIFRAKGNEAPMVYILDSQYAVDGPNLITRRNTLFTAITRSRAWVRICGSDADASRVQQEFSAIRARDYALSFEVPTPELLSKLRRIHRDRTEAELESIKRATSSATELINIFERGGVDIENLPPSVRTKLALLLNQPPSEPDEEP